MEQIVIDNDDSSSAPQNDVRPSEYDDIKYPQHILEKVDEQQEMLPGVQTYTHSTSSSRGTTEVESLCYSEDIEDSKSSLARYENDFLKFSESESKIQSKREKQRIKNLGSNIEGARSKSTREDHVKMQYYMIIYKGVVALTSETNKDSKRSGVYVSYGEIVASSWSLDLTSSQKECLSNSTLEKTDSTVIRVDKVITGGYAVDAMHTTNEISETYSTTNTDTINTADEKARDGQYENYFSHKTPKRSNVYNGLDDDDINCENLPFQTPTINSPDANSTFLVQYIPNNNNVMDNHNENNSKIHKHKIKHHGFLHLTSKGIIIAQKIDPPLLCDSGNFTYQVCSSTPLPILVGPCDDAPPTRDMALPGTCHQISLRIRPVSSGSDGPIFLRLSHRRGWLPDRKVIKLVNQPKHVTETLKEVVINHQIQISSSTNHSLSSTQTSNSIRRRRPPRRVRLERLQQSSRRNNSSFIDPINARCDTFSSITTTHLDSITSPANKSILSEDSFLSLTTKNVDLDVASTNTQQTQLKSNPQMDSNHGLISSPSFFLMRVHAPLGLKILDAPHFQVNKLIHGQTSQSNNKPTSPASSTGSISKAPSSVTSTTSLFHNITSVYNNNGSDSTSQKTIKVPYQSSGRTRVLKRGTIFEASKRMESAGVYTPGAALIKLSDKSGWAIVPHEEDLLIQFHNNNSSGHSDYMQAVEEIGNAITDSNSSNQTLWLRIFPRAGIYVVCPPPPPLPQRSEMDDVSCHSPPSSVAGSTITASHANIGLYNAQQGMDFDGASSVGGSTTISFRTPRKDHFIARPHTENVSKIPLRSHNNHAVLPCGMCVEVDPWEFSHPSDPQSKPRCSQSFARLVGGQGWIPRQINGELFSFKIDRPHIQYGSFWFRVLTKRGIKVRKGPSRRASSIESEKGQSFRFECGEFLRASEIITFYGTSDASTTTPSNPLHQNANEQMLPFSECFAKLYRNSKPRRDMEDSKSPSGKNSSGSQLSTASFRSLSDLATPGEWVQVHINGKHYLEECKDPPSISRHFDGWRYHAVRETIVRRGPSFLADELPRNKMLRTGDSVLVNERVTAFQDKVTWLRLKDGQGWVHDIGPHDELVMIAHSQAIRNGKKKSSVNRPFNDASSTATSNATYNSIISRLFSSDNKNPAAKGK